MSYLRYVCLFAHCCSQYILCFCFVFRRLVYPVFPVFLGCQFLLALSVFSNVYLFLDNTSIPILEFYQNCIVLLFDRCRNFFFRVTDNYIIFNGIITNVLYFSCWFSYRDHVGGVRHITFRRG